VTPSVANAVEIRQTFYKTINPATEFLVGIWESNRQQKLCINQSPLGYQLHQQYISQWQLKL